MSDHRTESDFWRRNRSHTLTVDQAEEIDRRCDLFEAAWRGGECPRHEDHLGSGDGPFRVALIAELIAVELEWRRRLGDVPAKRTVESPTTPVDSMVTWPMSSRGESVLDRISTRVGAVTRVLLRDTDGGPETPLHRPNQGGDPGPGLRYRIDGEIARGGMGSVLKGRDSDLGRDVALKVLREDLRDNVEMVRRFVEEAQIGGQLQHPGIVPIYEMGTFTDRRPFFSMKLVKGDTLAKLLANRKNPVDDLPKFLSIFESISQTVAYSHARGVIHRDLKPSNVMVGNFGEVQVMDWGLAKVLAQGGVVDDAGAGKVAEQETVVATTRSGSDEPELSQAGSVLGTPSYMAPEQARGEIDRIDERADVFALGSILCEILTGSPAFIGRISGEILRKAALGDLADATARLDASGADADLIALAKDSLARESQDRPRSASLVSDRVTAHLAGVQERLRRAELESVEERARRRLTAVAAASLILLGLTGAGGYAWNLQQQAERLAKTSRGIDDALTDAARLSGEAQAAPAGETGRWSLALSAAKRAEGLVSQGEADASLKERVETLMAQLEREEAAAAAKGRQIEVDRVLLDELETVRGNRAEHLDLKRADAEYGAVFRRAGLDLDAIEPGKAGRWLASRTDPVEMAGYLDDWAFARRAVGRAEPDWRRLVAAARGGDPDPWRDVLRAKFGGNDAGTVAEFRRMADQPGLEDQPAAGLLLLARLLKFSVGDGARAAEVLRRGSRRHSGDFRIHFELALAPGESLESQTNLKDLFPDPGEAVRHLTAAAAIRPRSVTTHVVLGMALNAQMKLDEAVSECREAVRLKPDSVNAHVILGNALRWQEKLDEAVVECREAIRLGPDDARAHNTLAIALDRQGKLDEAAGEYREAIRLKHDLVGAYAFLAQALQRKRDLAGALAVLRDLNQRFPPPVVDPWDRARRLARVESLMALADRLPAILKGEDRPGSVAERLDLAQMCYDQKRYAAAAQLWGEAMEEDPKLADDRRAQHSYNAACAALLACSGRGMEEPVPDDQARNRLRLRARDWLWVELRIWSRTLKSDPPTAGPPIVITLRHWRKDSDLASVRDSDALARLPEAERNDWLALWEEVDALLRTAGEAKPR